MSGRQRRGRGRGRGRSVGSSAVSGAFHGESSSAAAPSPIPDPRGDMTIARMRAHASARRGDHDPRVSTEEPRDHHEQPQPQDHQVEPDIEQDVPVAMQEDPPQAQEQQDQQEHPLFRRFHLHVCHEILRHPQYQKVLKSINHGNKIVSEMYPVSEGGGDFFQRVINSRLAPLLVTGHTTVDNHLLSAFVERWHRETSSFHLPFGEMTITLDDVSMLLGIPIIGRFYSGARETVTQDIAIGLAEEYLGVTREEAVAQVATGPYYRFSWLVDIYCRHIGEDGDHDIALRVYLLLLLSYSIFTVKTGDRAEAKWLLILKDLHTVSEYAWGTGALVHLYDQLSFSSLESTTELSGYPSLLQAWILWRFPTIAERRPGAIRLQPGQPLGGRYRKKKTDHIKVTHYRRMIDDLSASDVVWTPYEQQQREAHPFSLFRGFLIWDGTRVPYMPDRCLRQFRLVQVIPLPPLTGRPSYEDCMRVILEFQEISGTIRAMTRDVQDPWEVAPDYLEWYASTSRVGRLLPLPVQQPQDQGAQHESPLGMVQQYQSTFLSGCIRWSTMSERVFVQEASLDVHRFTGFCMTWLGSRHTRRHLTMQVLAVIPAPSSRYLFISLSVIGLY